jgi:hypothetical protein
MIITITPSAYDSCHPAIIIIITPSTYDSCHFAIIQ